MASCVNAEFAFEACDFATDRVLGVRSDRLVLFTARGCPYSSASHCLASCAARLAAKWLAGEKSVATRIRLRKAMGYLLRTTWLEAYLVSCCRSVRGSTDRMRACLNTLVHLALATNRGAFSK